MSKEAYENQLRLHCNVLITAQKCTARSVFRPFRTTRTSTESNFDIDEYFYNRIELRISIVLSPHFN